MGGSQLTFGWVETTNQFSAILLLVVSCKPLWSPCNHHQSFFFTSSVKWEMQGFKETTSYWQYHLTLSSGFNLRTF